MFGALYFGQTYLGGEQITGTTPPSGIPLLVLRTLGGKPTLTSKGPQA